MIFMTFGACGFRSVNGFVPTGFELKTYFGVLHSLFGVLHLLLGVLHLLLGGALARGTGLDPSGGTAGANDVALPWVC